MVTTTERTTAILTVRAAVMRAWRKRSQARTNLTRTAGSSLSSLLVCLFVCLLACLLTNTPILLLRKPSQPIDPSRLGDDLLRRAIIQAPNLLQLLQNELRRNHEGRVLHVVRLAHRAMVLSPHLNELPDLPITLLSIALRLDSQTSAAPRPLRTSPRAWAFPRRERECRGAGRDRGRRR